MFRKKKQQPVVRRGRDMSSQQSFKRSQTLTGTSSNTVRAAGESTATLQSERLQKRVLHQRRQMLVGMFLVVALICSGLYYMISQYIGSVDSLEYSAGATVNSSQSQRYQKALASYFAEQPGERFHFSVNEKRLTEAVQTKHPEVKAISVSKDAFDIELRKPVAEWVVGDAHYFVDTDGQSFRDNYYATPTLSVKDNSGAAAGDGSTLASRSFLRFLGRMVALIESSGLGKVTEASLPPNTTREIDFKIEGRGYVIKTHTERDPAQEVEDLQRVVKYLEAKSITPGYIDIRIAGKAYYR